MIFSKSKQFFFLCIHRVSSIPPRTYVENGPMNTQRYFGVLEENFEKTYQKLWRYLINSVEVFLPNFIRFLIKLQRIKKVARTSQKKLNNTSRLCGFGLNYSVMRLKNIPKSLSPDAWTRLQYFKISSLFQLKVHQIRHVVHFFSAYIFWYSSKFCWHPFICLLKILILLKSSCLI